MKQLFLKKSVKLTVEDAKGGRPIKRSNQQVQDHDTDAHDPEGHNIPDHIGSESS